jgi:pyruvate formate lyase activating enzyme
LFNDTLEKGVYCMASLVTNIQGYSIHDGPGIRTVVFFKGCRLACQWCSNPECISPSPEVGFVKSLCTKCGKCAEICPVGALVYEAGKLPRIDRERCTGCGLCSAVCSYKALALYGVPMTVDEIFEAVNRDKMFYEASGGGVTVSGGEALLQLDLVLGLFEKCRRDGIHTCIETSGCVTGSSFNKILPLTDYILFDLKHLNPDKHLLYTGMTNTLILSNARVAAASGIKTLFRMPLIPGINDDMQNIRETAVFICGLGNTPPSIELMPYHRLGKGKYDSLDKLYHLPGVLSSSPEHIESVKKMFEDNGIKCTISR